MIDRILCAAIDIGDDILVGVQFQKHLALKGEAALLGFRARPCVVVRFFPAVSPFGVEVELSVIGVVSDGPGVPDGRMAPGRFPHRKHGFDRPRFPPLAS